MSVMSERLHHAAPLTLVAALVLFPVFARAKPAPPHAHPTSHPPHPTASVPPPPPPPPVVLPGCALIPRVDIELRKDAALVSMELTVCQGKSIGDSFDAHVAFGAPGVPRAFDAHLLPVHPGFFSANPEDQGAPLSASPTQEAAPTSAWFFGSASEAGMTLHIDGTLLQHAWLENGLASIRLREVIAIPASAQAKPSLAIPLAWSHEGPFPLGTVHLSGEGLAADKVQASLCGINVEEIPLVWISSRGEAALGVPPLQAPRSTLDYLCLRLER